VFKTSAKLNHGIIEAIDYLINDTLFQLKGFKRSDMILLKISGNIEQHNAQHTMMQQ
jgi:hypothetical protein